MSYLYCHAKNSTIKSYRAFVASGIFPSIAKLIQTCKWEIKSCVLPKGRRKTRDDLLPCDAQRQSKEKGQIVKMLASGTRAVVAVSCLHWLGYMRAPSATAAAHWLVARGMSASGVTGQLTTQDNATCKTDKTCQCCTIWLRHMSLFRPTDGAL